MTTPDTPAAWVRHLWGRVLFAGTADAPGRLRLAPLLLVALLPAVLLYPCRGFHLLEPDEGRYAQIPREMLDRGDWVVPTLQGEPYLDKPPLTYWLVALSYRLFGVSPEAARLVPAVCVHLTILAVFLLGRRSVGDRAAFWAALLLAVAPGFVGVARLLLLDGLLTLCVALSVLCGFEAVRAGRLKWGWWLLSAAASGLGFLTKGPISEVLLFVPLWAFGWLSRGRAEGGRGKAEKNRDPMTGGSRLGSDSAFPLPPSALPTPSPFRLPPSGYAAFAAVVVAVNLPWYVGIYLKEPAFLKYFFWEHNVLRFLQPFDHLQPVWYYAPILLAGLLPGTALLAAYLWQLATGGPDAAARRSPAGGFWLLAGAWCVLFFSVSGSKLPTYVLPAYPFLCLALGEYVARSRWDTAVSTRVAVGGVACVLAGLHFAGLPWYARERSPVGRPELVGRFADAPPGALVSYPRHCDSFAFRAGRSDVRSYRTKDVNELLMDCHRRPRTTILFTHRDALAGFKNALPPSLAVVEEVSLKRTYPSPLLGKLVGSTPWGLCDVAVVVPLYQVPPGTHQPRAVARAQQQD